jgi:hypothetical protein
MTKVKNLNNTGDKNCSCSGGDNTWIGHWEMRMGEYYLCSNLICPDFATRGGHVKKVDAGDDSHYIVPLCASCNGLEEPFDIQSYDILTSAECI